tara:strand:- start:490 stop:702 length:213 start_codon:yes stop_codon:yes gene_type:complete
MTRGATGSCGYNQIKDSKAYFKNYYKINKEKLKRMRVKRLIQQKRNAEFVKKHQSIFNSGADAMAIGIGS